jgi:uncharacterized protein Yka (UPF0111/DUF47 family)
MTIASRINLLVIAGVVAAGATATALSVRALGSAGEREAAQVRQQLLLGKQEKLKDLVRNTHRAVEELCRNARDPERVADTYRPLLKGAVDEAFSAIETVYADPTLAEAEKQARAMAVVKGLRSLGNRAGEAMTGIQERVGSAADQAGQIASATEQLRATVSDIAQNMDQIAREIEQNSAATDGVTGNARVLAEKSEQVQALSGRFRT